MYKQLGTHTRPTDGSKVKIKEDGLREKRGTLFSMSKGMGVVVRVMYQKGTP